MAKFWEKYESRTSVNFVTESQKVRNRITQKHNLREPIGEVTGDVYLFQRKKKYAVVYLDICRYTYGYILGKIYESRTLLNFVTESQKVRNRITKNTIYMSL